MILPYDHVKAVGMQLSIWLDHSAIYKGLMIHLCLRTSVINFLDKIFIYFKVKDYDSLGKCQKL